VTRCEPDGKPQEGLEMLGGILFAPNRFVALSDALAGLATVLKAERPMTTQRRGSRPGRWRQSASRPSMDGGLKNISVYVTAGQARRRGLDFLSLILNT
jgi:hypothetical protein